MKLPEHSGWSGMPAEQVQREVDWLKTRLSSLGHDGDCAYERAMAGFYRQMLQDYLEEFPGLVPQARAENL